MDKSTLSNLTNLTPDEALETLKTELLGVIVDENEAYPWNPEERETEAYFNELETEFALTDIWDEAEMTTHADHFFAEVNKQWSTQDTTPIKTRLYDRFASRLPKHRLEQIIEAAQHTIEENIDQLQQQVVECVKPLWQGWTDAELYVFARPLVSAMRGSTPIKQAPWEELSEIDQIRLSMIVAQEAIDELSQQSR